MTEDEKMKQLDEFVVTIELPIRVVNAMLNAFNTPFQVPTSVLYELMMLIQNQAFPQADKAKKALEAVMENADHVPLDLEERN
jgi:hypothetical protein